ncbi:MAG: hypothetical protein KatS3mg123_1310 [Burkholderiales bacterium]|nr:MAG: hypothetical protein KatS3mg123_1310 [Burkholderiales bacterium]
MSCAAGCWLRCRQRRRASRPRGRVVCNCLNVSEREIAAAIDAGANLQTLQQTLQCGTQCGSCVPELRRMLASRRQAA